jgi:DNA uptake protein ComE-like DNA-binding protein
MRGLCCLLVLSLLLPAVPLSAQTPIVHVNRRGPYNLTLVDLNTATKDELMTLPSVGEPEADRIIKGRPYESKQLLLDEKVVSREVYERIEKRITTIASAPKGKG